MQRRRLSTCGRVPTIPSSVSVPASAIERVNVVIWISFVGPTRADPEIHGVDGLAGGEGLPDSSHPGVQARLKRSSQLKAIHGMAKTITRKWKGEGVKVRTRTRDLQVQFFELTVDFDVA